MSENSEPNASHEKTLDETINQPNLTTLLHTVSRSGGHESYSYDNVPIEQPFDSHSAQSSVAAIQSSTTLNTSVPELPQQPSLNQTQFDNSAESFFSSLTYTNHSSYHNLANRPLSLVSTLSYYQQETRTILDQLTFHQHAYPPELQEELDLLAEELHHSARSASRINWKIQQYDEAHQARVRSAASDNKLDPSAEIPPIYHYRDKSTDLLAFEKDPNFRPCFVNDANNTNDDAISETCTSLHTCPSMESVGLAVNPTPLQYFKYGYRRARKSLVALSRSKKGSMKASVVR